MPDDPNHRPSTEPGDESFVARTGEVQLSAANKSEQPLEVEDDDVAGELALLEQAAQATHGANSQDRLELSRPDPVGARTQLQDRPVAPIPGYHIT